jgi:serine/threonine-protein kinase HipA
MITTAFVTIWNKRVGAIAWDSASGMGSFEYDPAFISQNLNLSPIFLPITNAAGRVFSFPELRSSDTFHGLPGLVADVLPDKYGNALINAWLNRQGRPSNSLNPVETLCFIGNRGMGALEFEPAFPKNTLTASKIEIANLVDIAEQILSEKVDFSTNLSSEQEKSLIDMLKIGTSAGGARAKAIITYNQQTGEVRSGQTAAPKGFSHWLIKFDGVLDSQFGVSNGYGRVEMAYYLMAIDAGIDMMESRLLEENGRAHFMTKRFDRTATNEKLHMQSFCAMRHFDFNDVTLYSYEQLFETMRMLGLHYPAAEQLFLRMVLNVLARNCDDHTKNFAFVMDPSGNWSLSPAYDVCHAYRPGSPWVSQHSLSVNGKRKNIQREDLLAVAKQMNIKKAGVIVDAIAKIVGNWDLYAEKTGVEPLLATAIKGTLLII